MLMETKSPKFGNKGTRENSRCPRAHKPCGQEQKGTHKEVSVLRGLAPKFLFCEKTVPYNPFVSVKKKKKSGPKQTEWNMHSSSFTPKAFCLDQFHFLSGALDVIKALSLLPGT